MEGVNFFYVFKVNYPVVWKLFSPDVSRRRLFLFYHLLEKFGFYHMMNFKLYGTWKFPSKECLKKKLEAFI